MARKLVLCLSSAHLTAGVWNGRRLVTVRRFRDEDEADQRAFANLLRGARNVPVYLMADTLDEDYRFETLPHASGKDRREMLERKLKQLYRSTPFYGAAMQERESGRRRDDRFLFAALTNPDAFATWWRILTASGCPIAAVFPLPMVSLGLLKRLDLKEPNLLLVSKDEAGVRQTFVKEQRFRISRLTPLRQGQAASSLESTAEEIRNTRMYLDALNVTHVDEVLTVVLLDHDGSLAPLTGVVAAGRRNIRVIRISAEDITSKLGIDRSTLGSSPDALHLFLLGQESPSFNLAPPVMTSGFRRMRISHGIYGAVAAAGVAAAALCGFNFYQVVGFKEQTREIAARTQQETMRYQELTRSFPPAPVSSEKLQLTVEVAERIAGLARLPDTVFSVVSQGLGRYPNIKLNSVDWKVGRPSTAATATTPVAAPLSQSAVIGLELTAQPGDYKGALADMNSFVHDLGKNDKVADAKVVKLPLNLASSGTLTGSTTTPRQEQPQQAQFEIELTLKPGV